jgi:hypothetical protein
MSSVLARRLPRTFRGWSTNYGPADEVGVRLLRDADGDTVAHRVEFSDAGAWFRHVVGFDPADGVSVRDWLAIPTQVLRSVTAGAVFEDALDVIEPRRAALRWYPDDVWRFVLGCQWMRLAQEESFVGRAGEVGDDLGSRVVAARVVRDLMRLCFLLERQHAPYSKWLGRAFEDLAVAPEVGPHLLQALRATSWQRREAEIGAAAELVAARQNALALAVAVDTTLRPYHDRPFLVLDASRFATVCFDAIQDEAVAALVRAGSVDQWIDSTEVLQRPSRARRAFDALSPGAPGSHRSDPS